MDHGSVYSVGDNNLILQGVSFGDGANVVNASGSPQRHTGRWKIGIITVLSCETAAIHDLLNQVQPYTEQNFDGRPFCEARLDGGGGSTIRAVATQSLVPGQRPALTAYQHLRTWYAPRVIALVGIAGSIHSDAGLGDVVIGNRIVYYESRREDPGETRFRGESHDVPPAIQHALNAFFSRHGEPATLRRWEGRRTVSFKVMRGPIGSGEAVIRDEDSQARRWLRAFNDKVLATETEGAALAHGFHEDRDAGAAPRGWVVVRGISDHADPRKDDAHHVIASRNAAHAFAALSPYLVGAEEAYRA